MALTGWYCAVPGIMIEFIKVFAAFGAKIKRSCKNTKKKTDFKLLSIHKDNEENA